MFNNVHVVARTIHANTCIQTTTPLRNRFAMMVWSSSLHSLSRRFFQLLRIMDPRTVDPLLNEPQML